MPDLRSSSEAFLAFGVKDFFRAENQTDCVFIAEGGERIKCHQCILVCSPVLKSIFETSEIKFGGNTPTLSIPDFHPESIRKLLQFIYEGEVSLQKASRTLIEFKELCNILEINPPVNKYRCSEETKKEPQDQESPPSVFSCDYCSTVLKDKASHDSHVTECETRTRDSFKMPDNFDLPEEIIKSSAVPPAYALNDDEEKSNFEASSEEIQENEVDSTSSPAKRATLPVESSGSEGLEDVLQSRISAKKESLHQPEKKKKLISDLFGDDLALPAIKKEESKKLLKHYGKKTSSLPVPQKKSSPPPSQKKESTKSVTNELDEKRKRTILKLKDETTSEKRPKQSGSCSKWIVNDSSASESDPDPPCNNAQRDEDIEEFMKGSLTVEKLQAKRRLKRRLEVIKEKYERRRISSSSSEDEDSLPQSSRQSRLLERRDRQGLGWMVRGNGRKVKVSVQLEGKESFIEYATYKLRLICGSDEGKSSSSSSDDESMSRLRRIRKKDPSSYQDTKWDKLKLKRLERSKSVSEIKSIIDAKTAAKQGSSSAVPLKRSSSEVQEPSFSSAKRPPQYDNKPFVKTYPFAFNYGLSSENKLLQEKRKSEALLSLSKVSFKKKPSTEANDASLPQQKPSTHSSNET